jgi:hypothetical protein
MGQQRGLTGGRWVAVVGLLLGLAPAGCSKDEPVEPQRALLRGRDRAAERQAAAEKRRVRTPEGDLLPSDAKVAGIVLPRGFALELKLEGGAYYEAKEPLDKTEEYFTHRLTATRASRNELQELEFYQAREQADPQMEPAFVRIARVPGHAERTRIHVMEPVKQQVASPLSFEESQRHIAESLKRAR